MIRFILIILFLLFFPSGREERLSKNPLFSMIKEANSSCSLYDLGKNENVGRFLKGSYTLECFTKALLKDGFSFNAENDTIVMSICANILRIDGLPASIDAYSALGESHIILMDFKKITIEQQDYNPEIARSDMGRIIRNSPESFLCIYQSYGEPLVYDVDDDRSLRVVIKDRKIVTVEGWVYTVNPWWWELENYKLERSPNL